ncbi:hypothetical protein BS78_06G290200 [Paspalum vaginatum]|nr:hypothetical protein BS78_06G290200 [Paspalum vaginatum]
MGIGEVPSVPLASAWERAPTSEPIASAALPGRQPGGASPLPHGKRRPCSWIAHPPRPESRRRHRVHPSRPNSCRPHLVRPLVRSCAVGLSSGVQIFAVILTSGVRNRAARVESSFGRLPASRTAGRVASRSAVGPLAGSRSWTPQASSSIGVAARPRPCPFLHQQYYSGRQHASSRRSCRVLPPPAPNPRLTRIPVDLWRRRGLQPTEAPAQSTATACCPRSIDTAASGSVNNTRHG